MNVIRYVSNTVFGKRNLGGLFDRWILYFQASKMILPFKLLFDEIHMRKYSTRIDSTFVAYHNVDVQKIVLTFSRHYSQTGIT